MKRKNNILLIGSLNEPMNECNLSDLYQSPGGADGVP